MKIPSLKMKDFEIHLKLVSVKFGFGMFLAAASFAALKMYGAAWYVSLVFPAAFLGIGSLEIKCNRKISAVLNLLWAAGSALVLFYLPQYLMKLGIDGISIKKKILGVLFTGAVILLGYIFTRNTKISVIVSEIFLLGMAIVNYYVVAFRGEELSPADFLAMGTAANVASQYDYSVNAQVIKFVCLALFFVFCGFCIPNFKGKFKIWNSVLLAGTEIAIVACLFLGIKNIHAEHFMTTGSQNNGFYVNFLAKLKGSGVEKPEGYGELFLDTLAKEYGNEKEVQEKEESPDIIVIMAEAFGDLRVMGDLNTDAEVMPFFDSVKEDAIRGNAIVSVYGGGTCNSEFEALTGFSMSNLPFKTFPFQQYVKQNMWSMARYLESLGYETMATHPENEVNWKRNVAYPCLGFDETHFIDDYPQEKLVRGHVSDQEMYEQIISWYESGKKDSPLFYFGVTMQNHSPYDSEDLETTVHLEGYSKEYPEVEQYLTLTQKSDEAIGQLVEYFKSVENDVVVVVFGDHMPKLDAFYEEINGGPLDSLQSEMNKRTVPFFIWTNYDIEEKEMEYSSLNYLSGYIYEAAGIELPVYNRFLKKIEEKIPAISALGYYSEEKGAFAKLEEMTQQEQELMNQYAILQYNGMFDSENNHEMFFPLGE